MRYSLPFDDLATSASANTFKTMIAMISADVAGRRFRVRSLQLGFADDTPADTNLCIQMKRIADVSAGTAGTAGTTLSAANVPKKEPTVADTVVTCKRNYSAEPTAYEAEALFETELNARGSIIKEWSEVDAPVAGQDMHIGLLVAPRNAAARQVSGSIEFEQF